MSTLKIMIIELDYEFLCEWNHAEYPQVGDNLSILHICSKEQEDVFEKMPLPHHLTDNNYNHTNAAQYIDYCGFIVTCRSWGRNDTLTIFCKRDD